MRTMIAVLGAILFCLSCQDKDGESSRNSQPTAKRQTEIARLMTEHYPSFKYDFDIRGPLTTEQLEQELIQYHEKWGKLREKAGGSTEPFENSEVGKRYTQVRDAYQKGDEFYFFRSERRSWGDLNGKEGYVLVRKDTLIDLIVTLIN